jgi:hypothetical protein
MDASFAQSSFLGGEVSKSIQGRFDLPDYRTWMNVCLNGFPIETGAWVRRPGTQFAATTRSGFPGRLIKFDFEANSPYNMEFTDGHLRFFNGPSLVTGNDAVAISSISTANPAVVALSAAVTWASNDQVFFSGLGATSPLLQNRVFIGTVVDSTHISLTDAITGVTIDGSTLGWAATTGAMLERVLDFATGHSTDQWTSLRSVQTEADALSAAFLMTATLKPYVVTVTAAPTDTTFATFTYTPAVFNDGPYFDPVKGGALVTPSAVVGLVTLTLSFNAWVSTTAYSKGDLVTYSSVNYRSLIEQNVNLQPDTHLTSWEVVTAGVAVGPNGFVATDIGRSVRMFSEPALWAVGTTYSIGSVISYNPSGIPGATTYWTSLINSNTGKQPGLDAISWILTPQGAAQWTWGKITALSNIIDRSLAGSVNIGNSTWLNGGLPAAFDGVTDQSQAAGAFWRAIPYDNVQGSAGIGKDYSGASAQKIGSVTVYPPANAPFVGSLQDYARTLGVTINLRASQTAPVFADFSAGGGTLLGTSGAISLGVQSTTAIKTPITVESSDTTTSWKYVWVEIIGTVGTYSGGYPTDQLTLSVAEVQFFSPPGTGVTGNGATVQILGPPLLYTSPIRVWRLGLYSDTTGWPTCGTYHEGRLWLSGAVPNRIDACYSNGAVGGTVNFAPTDQYGVVTGAHAISYTFNSPDTNPIYWMEPDLQGIICGTKAGEWLVQPPTPGAISPLNIAARRVTKIGCANIEPRRTEHTTVFVQKYGRKIMEYFADVYSGKFTAPHLSFKGKHLTRGGIDEIAYQQELSPTVWARVKGALIGCTYKRDTLTTAQGPTIAGWHPHTLGTGRSVESLCVGPSIDGTLDSLSIVTNDTASGVRHVEIMTSLMDEGAALADAWFLDDAILPSSTTSSVVGSVGYPYGGLTINGLWHLNGKSVSVFAGGYDCGDFTVASGSIVVPYGDGVSAGTASGNFTPELAATATIVAGMTYNSDGQIVRPATTQESGARNGPALAKTRRTHQYGILVDSTAGLSMGTSFAKLDPVLFKNDAGASLQPGNTFSGVYRTTVTDDYSVDSMLCWRVSRPLPVNIMAAGPFLHTQDV